jgi:hypothetical protein
MPFTLNIYPDCRDVEFATPTAIADQYYIIGAIS